MKAYLRQGLSLIAGIAAIALGTGADAARIDGLSAFEPVSADAVVPLVDNGTMHIGLPDGRSLTVAPWPAFLPQRFGKQTVTGTRKMHPAGPVDRLLFSRASEQSPWLAIGSGARRSTAIIGNWRLQLSGRRWSVSDGKAKKRFANNVQPAGPAKINAGADRWCIYLLESETPVAQPNIAMEVEPQIGWAAIRLGRLQGTCPVQK